MFTIEIEDGRALYNKLGFQGASCSSFILIEHHFLFVYIVKQKQKKFADFIKKFHGLSKLNENRVSNGVSILKF